MATTLLPNVNEMYEQISDLEKREVTDSHLADLKALKDFIREYVGSTEVNNDNGCHFSTCVWSTDTTSGPDTCGCYHMERKVEDFNNLIQEISTHLDNIARIRQLEARLEVIDTETPVPKRKNVFCCF